MKVHEGQKAVTVELTKAEARKALGQGKGFGNIGRGRLAGTGGSFAATGRGFLQGFIPAQVKPVPVITGTVLGVGFNAASSRLLESPKVGVNLNPLLSRTILAGLGAVIHVLARTNFTLGFMLGQVPSLVETGVSALMDMALGESPGLQGARRDEALRGLSPAALAEVKKMREKLEASSPTAQAARRAA